MNEEDPDRSKSLFDHTRLVPAGPKGADPGWQEAKIYVATALTGVSSQLKQALNRETAIIDDVVRRIVIKGHRPILYSPAIVTGPESQPDLLPHEVYARDLREAATATSIFAFLAPPSHGVGMEMQIASASGIPLVLFDRVDHHPYPALDPPFLLEIPPDSNPEYLRPISRMVRGLSLSKRPALVRYTDRYDLRINFGRFWQTYGKQLLDQGEDSSNQRRVYWTHACHAILRRRRILFQSRDQLANQLGCHASLIENLEREARVFSALNVANILNLLQPLGLRFEQAKGEEEGDITFGSANTNEAPYPAEHYRAMKESHEALCQFVASTSDSTPLVGPWEDEWERLWFLERSHLNLPPAVFVKDKWQLEDAPPPEPTLFQNSDADLALAQQSFRGMPRTAQEWQQRWDQFKRALNT